LNNNVRGLGESPTLAINERVKLLQSQGRKNYNFGLGQSPFPVPAPVVEALRLHAHEKDYLPVKGLPALKETVAGFHRQKNLMEANTLGERNTSPSPRLPVQSAAKERHPDLHGQTILNDTKNMRRTND
jgi:hypothetical protein